MDKEQKAEAGDSFQILLTTEFGTQVVSVRGSDTVESIKQHFRRKLCCPNWNGMLQCGTRPLEDGKRTLAAYGIHPDAQILVH